jgi:hypothetical protein
VARVVVLGASNVARGIATIADVARETFGSPVEIVAAMGHGRSYGLTTSIPFRTLPSILECGLWKALDERPPLPTWTLLTDIGNDLIYGCRPAQVVEWVDRCATRLRERSEHMALTGLPLESVARIGLLRFHAFRSLLFPRSRLTLLDAKRYAVELHDAVQRLAGEHRAQLVEPAPHWYGIDPIHIQIRAQREAWRKIFSALGDGRPPSNAETRSRLGEWWRVMTIRPEQSRVLLRDRRVQQPAIVLSDRSTISFF